jgi:hypothetical protein
MTLAGRLAVAELLDFGFITGNQHTLSIDSDAR